MLDDKLNPYLIEINTNPALFTDTEILKNLIPKLTDDVVAMAMAIHKPLSTESNVEDVRKAISELDLKLQYDECYIE
jgi:hypothetical protein